MDRVGPKATDCTPTEATASGHGHLLPGCMGTAVVLWSCCRVNRAEPGWLRDSNLWRQPSRRPPYSGTARMAVG